MSTNTRIWLQTEAYERHAGRKAWFMVERAVSDTERGDTEPGTAVVFML
jgi:hypothetical protein